MISAPSPTWNGRRAANSNSFHIKATWGPSSFWCLLLQRYNLNPAFYTLDLSWKFVFCSWIADSHLPDNHKKITEKFRLRGTSGEVNALIKGSLIRSGCLRVFNASGKERKGFFWGIDLEVSCICCHCLLLLLHHKAVLEVFLSGKGNIPMTSNEPVMQLAQRFRLFI